MKRFLMRPVTMSPRVLLAIFALQAPAALAQSDEYSAPPMVPVDEPQQPADVPPAEQPPAQPQQFQYAEPGTYANAPVDPAAPAPQQQPQKPAAKGAFAGTVLESTRSKHFLALASGGVGVTRASPGLALDVRAEADLGKFALLAGYTGFGSGNFANTASGGQSFLGHFMGLGGWAIFSREAITWRLLAGLDVINTPQANAVGFAVGTNVRAMVNEHFGVDSAIFVTPLPYRQFEFRAALVLRWWSIFEAHLGWRYQALEASQAGNVVTLFTTAPSINGPMAALGLTF